MIVPVAEILGQLESLVGQPGVADDYVRLRAAILRAQAIMLEELADSPLVPLAAQGPPRRPAIRPEELPFDLALGLRLFEGLVAVLRAHRSSNAALDAWADEVCKRPEELEELARRALATAEKPACDDLQHLVSRLLAAPFLTHAARRLSRSPVCERSESPRCPICGAMPGLASVGEDRVRRLHCSLCRHQWQFDRLRCPFCGLGDGALVRLGVRGVADRWIESCPECHGYVKVTDLAGRSAAPFVPLVEDAATLCLDMIATGEGCAAKPPYAAVG
ncbi:MAG: formate dehydrogenase accessory protein FdhE [Thermoguttaceae bacterium]|nr:formate dehydrogenase accessory protein FdhE [Thermoguttaceae bacterium]